MKKILIRTREHAVRIVEELMDDLDKTNQGLLLEWDEYSPPHSRGQQKKFYVMCRDLALFTGEEHIKDLVKATDIWPKVEKEHVFWKMLDGEQVPRRKITMDPKSEADLSREEESLIIELLFQWGDSLPGFTWSNPAERSTTNAA